MLYAYKYKIPKNQIRVTGNQMLLILEHLLDFIFSLRLSEISHHYQSIPILYLELRLNVKLLKDQMQLILPKGPNQVPIIIIRVTATCTP